MQRLPPIDFVSASSPVTFKISLQDGDRPRRYELRLPIYFREMDSPTWLEGRTENISYTGILLYSTFSLAPETKLDLRLQVALGTKGGGPTEVHCKGKVVRLGQRIVSEKPIALAVKIGDYRIVRGHPFTRSPSGNA